MKKRNDDAMEQHYGCDRHKDHRDLPRVLCDSIGSTQTIHAEKSNVEGDCTEGVQDISKWRLKS
eukprot:3087302-Amphidinium_carterae.1